MQAVVVVYRKVYRLFLFDIQAVVHNVLRHRIILSYEAQADGITKDQVISRIVELVAVP